MQASDTFTSLVASAGDHDDWWIWAPFFWVFWLVVLATIVWFVTRRGRWWNRSDRPKAILAERLARGEISIDEFRERIAELRNG
jgi:putative membrane protein